MVIKRMRSNVTTHRFRDRRRDAGWKRRRDHIVIPHECGSGGSGQVSSPVKVVQWTATGQGRVMKLLSGIAVSEIDN